MVPAPGSDGRQLLSVAAQARASADQAHREVERGRPVEQRAKALALGIDDLEQDAMKGEVRRDGAGSPSCLN